MVSEGVKSMYWFHIMLQTQKVSYVLNPLSSGATYMFIFWHNFPFFCPDCILLLQIYGVYLVMVNISEMLDIKIGL